jgi:uncharacterized protein (DUF302 family)
MMEHRELSVRLRLPHQRAVELTKQAVAKEGFGTLTEIDVKATVKEKLGADFRDYTIIGACNAPIAYTALQEDLEIGLFLPCNVIVYADGDDSVVTIQDPKEMLAMAKGAGLDKLAEIAREHLKRVVEALERRQRSERQPTDTTTRGPG